MGLEDITPYQRYLFNVKVAKVDLNICPVVNWLNLFESIMTVGSCEGDNGGNIPQVAFICSDSLILSGILRDIYDFNSSIPVKLANGMEVRNDAVNVSISWMPNMLNPLVYQISFGSISCLRRFIKHKCL
jgi:hypothetical protein